MNLDRDTKDAIQNLSNAVNTAVEKSSVVRNAIATLRELGFEPVLNLKLEILLEKRAEDFDDFAAEDLELSLTEEDVKTLQRMKIRF